LLPVALVNWVGVVKVVAPTDKSDTERTRNRMAPRAITGRQRLKSGLLLDSGTFVCLIAETCEPCLLSLGLFMMPPFRSCSVLSPENNGDGDIVSYFDLFLDCPFKSRKGSKTTCKPMVKFAHQMAKDFLLDFIKKNYQIIY
jgi:hypothetical protein